MLRLAEVSFGYTSVENQSISRGSAKLRSTLGSLERGFDRRHGRLTLQAGAFNLYDRRNMFYYGLFSGRRVDQLPLAPYAAVTMRGR